MHVHEGNIYSDALYLLLCNIVESYNNGGNAAEHWVNKSVTILQYCVCVELKVVTEIKKIRFFL